ncbi:unknown protein [Parachlamydia acanthamoebae UV-7]|uniref:Uncharacterized protein n=2 Tax=Parachlamydia acanthamoebae TaxID=83552 RepID=F8KVE6_PARAV|nr:hypothetical protein DB43_AA00090 [Parachlamydia acanthamoebae]CCB87673.1 unknown protein [Parachlamydia acanthamoebae UV-7]
MIALNDTFIPDREVAIGKNSSCAELFKAFRKLDEGIYPCIQQKQEERHPSPNLSKQDNNILSIRFQRQHR